MDFALTDTQMALCGLAEQIFTGQATVERVKEVEGSAERFDRRLWQELAKAGLLGICLPPEEGGDGLGVTELCLVLEQQGRRVAPVPLLWTQVAALTIARFAPPPLRRAWLPGVVAGDVVLTAALAQPGAGDPDRPSVEAVPDGDGWRLDGTAHSVAAGHLAARILIPARVTGSEPGQPGGRAGEAATGAHGELIVVLLDPAAPGVTQQRAEATNREWLTHLHLDKVTVAAADVVAGPTAGAPASRWAHERALVGLAALQLGVSEEALAQAAAYTSARHQFGKPLSSFQSTAARAADAYIDTEAMRATLWQAAWRLDMGMDASTSVEVAKWWASDGGQRVAARHPAPPRRVGGRHRVPRAPLLPVGQADRRHPGGRQRPPGRRRPGPRSMRAVMAAPGGGGADEPRARAAPGAGDSVRCSAVSPRWEDVGIGDELPPLDIPLTRTLIVATAMASHDFQDVHHDPALAQERGSPDIFMNILTTNGFVGRFVTDWAGPDAVLKRVAIRLGAPNYPGDTMHLRGSVVGKDGEAGTVEVSVRGTNSAGDHVTGTVSLTLPRQQVGA